MNLCKAIAVLGEASPRALDAVASLGERMSVRLLASDRQRRGNQSPAAIESSEFVVTNEPFPACASRFQGHNRKDARCSNPLLDEGIVPITTGFIGATPEGVITTLGRGGSDYSAAIIGICPPC
ncbi:MAG: hypothetical protein MZU91_02235 [Desulfosudis oleivorans]|nr:hypothetical protein [Desulfosudis oleivorans]